MWIRFGKDHIVSGLGREGWQYSGFQVACRGGEKDFFRFEVQYFGIYLGKKVLASIFSRML